MKSIVKKISFIIVLVFCFSTFFACNNANQQQSTKATVWSATNTDVILKEAEKGSGEAKIVFNTFKGDVEAAQFIITAKENIDSFSFVMGDVKTEKGDKLDASSFDVFAQRYIEVYQTTSDNCLTGFYPDALIPLANFSARKENSISKDNNQGIWINLNVPRDAKAGVYTGESILTLDGEQIKIPVSVTIYDIEMPEVIHTVSSFHFEASYISREEGKDLTEDLQRKYYNFLVSKRANAREIPNYFAMNRVYTPDQFASDVVEYVKNPMVSCYAIPYSGDSDGLIEYNYCYNMINALARKNKQLLDSGENIDLFKKAHYYLGSLIDEPTENSMWKVRECDLRIHKAKLAVAETGVLDDYPEVKASLLSLRHAVTTNIRSELYGTDDKGGVQTWVPLINFFGAKTNRELAIQRMNSSDRTGGESVWWYSCINPKNPFPSYQTDEDMLLARIRGWMQYDYKIQGNLYWGVNYWMRRDTNGDSPTDIWTEALSWEGANGDGRLIYPGKKYGVDGPISTFRLENIRESNEDYELLWLFEQTINDINVKHSKSFNSDKILSNFYSRLYENMFIFEDLTEEDFDNVRIELLQLLEKMINDSSSVLEQLDNLNK